jgi:cytidine deaminase
MEPWAGDRRQTGDRRRGRDRRTGDRRKKDVGRPEGERRSGIDRREVQRRSSGDRRVERDWMTVPLELTATTVLDPAVELVAAATEARLRAQARYSGFMVGAALETRQRRVITGCNIENATYGLTLCAERVALVKALSEGHKEFTRLVVVADTDAPTPPCGPCRQLLWEYCGDIEVVLSNLSGPIARYKLSSLLPLPFDGRLLLE